MRKPVFSVMLILLLLAGLVVATGAAGDEPEEVEVTVWWPDPTYEILPGQVAVLRAGWAACTPGLVRTTMVASNFEVTLDGVVILTAEDVDGLWQKFDFIDPEPEWKEDCLGNGPPAMAEWRYALDWLSPGTYTVECEIWMDKTTIDGRDLDGEPGPDRYPPEMFDRDTVTTIIVMGDE